jgi:hypothetical protein
MMNIGGLRFEGPFELSCPPRVAGVYAVICASTTRNTLVDVGESANIAARIAWHDRAMCWRYNCTARLFVYIFRDRDASRRRAIEAKIRHRYHPACGER